MNIAAPTFTGIVAGINSSLEGLGHLYYTSESTKPVSADMLFAINAKFNKLITYTKSETDAKFLALVNVAPAALDIHQEIAAALNNDGKLSGTLSSGISLKSNMSDVDIFKKQSYEFSCCFIR